MKYDLNKIEPIVENCHIGKAMNCMKLKVLFRHTRKLFCYGKFELSCNSIRAGVFHIVLKREINDFEYLSYEKVDYYS